jgi:hypothetical protein
MEDRELKITVDRVRRAAKSCTTARSVLSELFPEAFPVKGFRAGTIFRPKNPKGEKSAYPEFLILAHMGEARLYALINIRTGFQWGDSPANRRLFKRPAGPGKLIEFPDDLMDKLDVIAFPDEDYRIVIDNRTRREAT